MRARQLLTMVLNEGIEAHITQVLQDQGFSLGGDFWWEKGLCVSDETTGSRISDILNASGQFASTRFDPSCKKVKFMR